jgi:hypothetical protein
MPRIVTVILITSFELFQCTTYSSGAQTRGMWSVSRLFRLERGDVTKHVRCAVRVQLLRPSCKGEYKGRGTQACKFMLNQEGCLPSRVPKLWAACSSPAWATWEVLFKAPPPYWWMLIICRHLAGLLWLARDNLVASIWPEQPKMCLKTLQLYSKCYCVASVTKTFALRGVQTIHRSGCRLSANLVPTFADRGCRVVSTTDPYSRILGILDRRRYFFFQVAPQLYSPGWVDPVRDPLLLRKSRSAGNRTRTSGFVARNSGH